MSSACPYTTRGSTSRPNNNCVGRYLLVCTHASSSRETKQFVCVVRRHQKSFFRDRSMLRVFTSFVPSLITHSFVSRNYVPNTIINRTAGTWILSAYCTYASNVGLHNPVWWFLPIDTKSKSIMFFSGSKRSLFLLMS